MGRELTAVAGSLVALVFCACANTIPSKFVEQAERGVTLTALKTRPDTYRGKVVMLGGVIVDHKEEAGRIWLLMKNRPLDADYVPHRDVTLRESESGHYWVVVTPQGLPKAYRNWARVTVVGRVSDAKPIAHESSSAADPVLVALYLRGWGSGDSGQDVWESRQDANYIQSNPMGELRQ
jgi:starvation-inducible outer membrane lipoprotein